MSCMFGEICVSRREYRARSGDISQTLAKCRYRCASVILLAVSSPQWPKGQQ